MQTQRKNGLETQQLLLDVAERLFADKGIDNVTLADISREAKQKNRNAMQYHFGDKLTVLHALLERHRRPIGERRQNLLETAEAQSPVQIRPVIEALVIPLVERINHGESGIAYLRINAQLMASGSYAQFRQDKHLWHKESVHLLKLVKTFISDLTATQIAHRSLLVDALLFHSLASFAATRPSKQEQSKFQEELIVSIIAILENSPQ